MRILIHTDEYYPTAQACSYRMSVLADAFMQRGHKVAVITSAANKANGEVTERGERVLYSPAIRMKKKTALMRMLNNLSFGFTSIFAAIRVGKVDVVITTSPPPLVSIPGWIIARYKRAKLVYDVRDIWPDVALEMGSFAEDSIYCNVFSGITNFMYRRADWITTVSPGKVAKLQGHVRKWNQEDKVRLVANGFDERILNGSIDDELVAKYNLDSKFTCVYVGNIGIAQGLGMLLDMAGQSRHREVQFLLFGNGAEKDALAQKAKELGLENVHFCGVLPHEKVFTLLSKAKISFIPLKSANMRDSIPTKVYEALGIGCPVLLVAEGDACGIVQETKMGRCVSPEHPELLAETFDDMVDHYEAYAAYRAAARQLMQSRHSRQQIALDFENQLREWVGQ